jgi:hypothetical protein
MTGRPTYVFSWGPNSKRFHLTPNGERQTLCGRWKRAGWVHHLLKRSDIPICANCRAYL